MPYNQGLQIRIEMPYNEGIAAVKAFQPPWAGFECPVSEICFADVSYFKLLRVYVREGKSFDTMTITKMIDAKKFVVDGNGNISWRGMPLHLQPIHVNVKHMRQQKKHLEIQWKSRNKR